MKNRQILEKKNKSVRSQDFRADMQTIKEADVRKLQETFGQFFGSDPGTIRRHSSKIRNRIYFFGFAVTLFFVVIVYLTKKISFVG